MPHTNYAHGQTMDFAQSPGDAMHLSEALQLADHASPSPQEARAALQALRSAYLDSTGIARDAREAGQGSGPIGAALRSIRFPVSMSHADHASAITLLVDGRRCIVGVGKCSLHVDPEAGVIWGFPPAGRAVLAASKVDTVGAAAAIEWAVRQSLAEAA